MPPCVRNCSAGNRMPRCAGARVRVGVPRFNPRERSTNHGSEASAFGSPRADSSRCRLLDSHDMAGRRRPRSVGETRSRALPLSTWRTANVWCSLVGGVFGGATAIDGRVIRFALALACVLAVVGHHGLPAAASGEAHHGATTCVDCDPDQSPGALVGLCLALAAGLVVPRACRRALVMSFSFPGVVRRPPRHDTVWRRSMSRPARSLGPPVLCVLRR